MPPSEPFGASLVGVNHRSDAASASAAADAMRTLTNLSSLTSTSISNELSGVTVYPGVYSSATFLLAAGVLTFDALNITNATFVMVSRGYILVSALGSMSLKNGARASRIFWAIEDYASFAT